MIIVGIDPGYAIVGYGIIDYEFDKFKILDYGTITTPSDMPFTKRLAKVYDDILALLDRWNPDALSIEEIFFTTNAKTAVAVSQARGVIMVAAEKKGVNIYEYTPLQVKSAVVGYGKAEKEQVQEMTRLLLNLKTIPKPDDAADALAVAICHAHSKGSLLLNLKGAKK